MTTDEKIDKIYSAMVGDDLGNPGLISRVKECENYQQKDKEFKNKVAGGLFLGSTLIGAFWAWVLRQI